MRIIITGANSGIGKELKNVTLIRGYDFLGYDHADLDITDEDQVKKKFRELESADVLINNAGIVTMGTIRETDVAKWKRQIDTNLTGAYICTREFIKIANRGAKIVNISSTAAKGPRAGRAGYAASKAALSSLSMTLSEELKEEGIKVYCFELGACDTPMRHKIMPDDNYEHMLKPETVAETIISIIENGPMLDGDPIVLRGMS